MKFKICPSCGIHNAPHEYECIECGIDLTSINPTDDENEKTKSLEGIQTAAPVMVRVCESCGHRNPISIGECQNCQDDLTGIVPTLLNGTQKQSEVSFQVTLTSLDSEYAYLLQTGKTVVGRDETMSDYLNSKMYVSRKHAEFDLSDGKLTITNLSQSNYTFVNDQLCIANSIELHDGDIIGLGGNDCNGQRQKDAAYFLLRICACT